MSDLTIEDLVSEEAGEAAAEAGKQAAEAASGKGTGEWFLELYDRMQQDDVLMPILFGNDAIPNDQPQPRDPDEPMFNDEPDDDSENGEETESGVPELNAESIAGICEGIENTLGDVRISQIRAMCENRPEQVNQMIQQHL